MIEVVNSMNEVEFVDLIVIEPEQDIVYKREWVTNLVYISKESLRIREQFIRSMCNDSSI